MRLSEFLESFFHRDETIFGRALKAKGEPANIHAEKFEFTIDNLSDEKLQSYLRELNKNRGMYFVVNAGGNTDAEITRFNAAFCEIDNLPLQDQHDLFDNAPLPPSIRVETRKSVHAYWLLSEIITPAEFYVLQKGLIQFFNSDAGIHNASRLMRLPFFNHLQYENGKLEKKQVLINSYSDTRFSFSELANTYPFELPNTKKPTFKPFQDTADEARKEIISRIEQTEKFHRFGKFGYTNGVCHNGKVSDTALYVHYETGYVGCFQGCEFNRIAETFGVSFKR